MGYNTALLIMNDAAEGLKTDPNVGKAIYDALGEAQYSRNKEGVSFSIGNHANGGYLLPSRHADEVQIVAVGGNCMTRLGSIYYGWRDMVDPDKLVHRLADELGYKLVKK